MAAPAPSCRSFRSAASPLALDNLMFGRPLRSPIPAHVNVVVIPSPAWPLLYPGIFARISSTHAAIFFLPTISRRAWHLDRLHLPPTAPKSPAVSSPDGAPSSVFKRLNFYSRFSSSVRAFHFVPWPPKSNKARPQEYLPLENHPASVDFQSQSPLNLTKLAYP